MSKDKCTYCKKELTNKYSFSYGVPGYPQILACNRLTCKIMRKIKRKEKKMWQKIHQIVITRLKTFDIGF